jgi:hypothetical protein
MCQSNKSFLTTKEKKKKGGEKATRLKPHKKIVKRKTQLGKLKAISRR